jgi:hypothetical protein
MRQGLDKIVMVLEEMTFVIVSQIGWGKIIQLTKESQEPVHKLIPSLLTPKQLTRFSWPTSDPTFSPRVTSQT